MVDGAQKIFNNIGIRMVSPVLLQEQWMIPIRSGFLNICRNDDGYTYYLTIHSGVCGYTYYLTIHGGVCGITGGPRLNPFEILEAIAENFPELVQKLAEPL